MDRKGKRTNGDNKTIYWVLEYEKINVRDQYDKQVKYYGLIVLFTLGKSNRLLGNQ